MSKVMEKGTEKGIFLDGREYTAAGVQSVTYTADSGINIRFGLMVTGGSDAIFSSVMAERGDTATAYEPYHDSMDKLTAKVARNIAGEDARVVSRVVQNGGRNLFNINQATPSNTGNTAVTISGDSIRVYSTDDTGTYHATKGNVFTLAADVEYNISVTVDSIASGTISYGLRSGSGNAGYAENKIIYKESAEEPGTYSFSYTPTQDLNVYVSLFVTGKTEGETGDATFSNVMVEEGSSATDFEPYYLGLAELTGIVNTLLGVTE